MQIQIKENLTLNVSGFGGTAVNKNYGATAFALMGKIWPLIKEKNLKHKGLNIWIYEPANAVFAGVELEDPSTPDTGLELKTVNLIKYAYYKHIGPYSLISKSGDAMRDELTKMGFKTTLPYIEIYGHWTNDESKLETELLIAVGVRGVKEWCF